MEELDIQRMQRAKQSLVEFKEKLESLMERYFSEKLEILEKIDLLGKEAGELIKGFTLSNGKRIRGMLVCQGYLAAGGEDEDKIFPCAAGIEMLHNFFLIHDDIIDQSDERRNAPTIHKCYEKFYKSLFKPLEVQKSKHFAASMALMTGDLSCSLAYQMIMRSSFPPERIIKALNKMHDIVEKTVIGQYLDIVGGIQAEATAYYVQKIHELKTAKYTIEGPLLIGAILGSGNEELFECITKFAIPVGIAFQIQDDILGIFGSKEVLGKSVVSDIVENKKTLLVGEALRRGSVIQKHNLLSVLGNPAVTEIDMKMVKEIIRETGALSFSQKRAETLIKQGKSVLITANLPEKVKDFLMGLSDYIITRKY